MPDLFKKKKMYLFSTVDCSSYVGMLRLGNLPVNPRFFYRNI